MTCTVIRNGIVCGAAARAFLTTGCLHEHMDRDAICGSCLIEVRALMGLGRIFCTPCRSAGSLAHDCAVAEVREERIVA